MGVACCSDITFNNDARRECICSLTAACFLTRTPAYSLIRRDVNVSVWYSSVALRQMSHLCGPIQWCGDFTSKWHGGKAYLIPGLPNNCWLARRTFRFFPLLVFDVLLLILRARGGAVGWGTALQTGRSRLRFPIMSVEFFTHCDPGVDSASKISEYQEYFLGVKAAGVYCWQPYHLHVPIVYKPGSLSLLEPWGPVQACNGTALPFYSWCSKQEFWNSVLLPSGVPPTKFL
jgi:hypothetical protein